jgi:hypothetical protein
MSVKSREIRGGIAPGRRDSGGKGGPPGSGKGSVPAPPGGGGNPGGNGNWEGGGLDKRR